MDDLAILGATVLSDGAARAAHVAVANGRISYVGPDQPSAAETIDADGMLLTPGLIDIHLNGAAGLDFTSTTLDPLDEFEALLKSCGTTGYLATLNTDVPEHRLQALRTCRQVLSNRPADAPRCLGFMLEGPFYGPQQCGAHNAELFCDPTVEHAQPVIDACDGWLKVWSLAPERAGSSEFIAWLTGQGIVAAVGHSSASYEEASAAVAAGARLATHLYCCLDSYTGAGPTKRLGGNEGLLAHDEVIVEVLADDMHVTPTMQHWIGQVAGPRRVCVTTDAMAAAGLGDGVYHFLGQETHVVDGRAYRPDRTHFAGSTATLPQCLRNLQAATGWTDAEIAETATGIPAKLLGLYPERGRVAPGCLSELALWREGWEVERVIL